MRITATLLSLLISNLVFGQMVAGIKKAGDMASDNQAYSIIIDHAHNTILTGAIHDSANFGGTVVANRGVFDGFIVKYDSTGTLLWARDIGGTGQDMVGHAAVDASNNIYVAGRFKSPAVYFTPTDSLVKVGSASISNSFIAKYDASGNFVWARLISSTQQVETWAITVDPWGYPVIGGLFNTDMNISGTSLTNAYYNLYVAKYTSAGVMDWAKMGTSLGICKINELSCDQHGNIFAVGKLSSNLVFGSVTATNLGGDDAWFGKMDSAGTMKFMKVLGISYSVTTTDGYLDAGNTIQPDNLGNFYVGGSLLISYTIPTFSEMGFYAKYTDTGSQVWMQTFGTGSETVTGIAVDGTGNPYVSGLYYASETIGGSVVPYTTGGNTFIGRFDKATGNSVWIKTSTSTVGSSGNDMLGYLPTGALAIDPTKGTVMAAGQFKSQISFDSYSAASTTTMANASDIYMTRIWNYVPSLFTPLPVAEEVNVYPNPAGSQVNIVFATASWHKISLMSISGRVIAEWETNTASFSADLHEAPAGNYLLEFADNIGNRSVQKLTKM